ncbi:hypothetical protein CYY_007242, partial [Polysphondylium violaceum]
MESKFLLIFLCVCTTLIGVSADCVPLDYKFDPYCTGVIQDDGSFLSGKLLIKPKNSYSFQITPEPVAMGYTNGYEYFLSGGIDYNIYWTDGRECSEERNLFVPIPRYIIEQPKCKFSVANVSFIAAENLSETADCNPFCEITDSSVQLGYQLDTFECGLTVPFYEVNNNYPNHIIKNSYCYKNSGSVELVYKEQYSSWKLVLSSSQIEIQEMSGSHGIWEKLAPGDYQLLVESQNCGKQIIPIKISITWPTYYLEFGPNSICPRNSSISIHFDDPDVFSDGLSIRMDGKLISSSDDSIYRSNPTHSFLVELFYNYSCSSNTMEKDPVILGDIRYSVDSCDASNRKVHLFYNETLYKDVVVYTPSEAITPADKSFDLPSSSDFFIESKCHFTPIQVNTKSPIQPSYVIVKKEQFCGDTVDIFFPNYYQFDTLVLSNNGENHDGHGYFRNLEPINGGIGFSYSINGCTEGSIFVTTEQFKYSEYENIIKVLDYPGCGQKGHISYQVKEVKTGNLSKVVVEEFSSVSQATLVTSIDKCPLSFQYTWYLPYFEQYQYPQEFIIPTNTSCFYSLDGKLFFKNVLGITINSIQLDGRTYQTKTTLQDGVSFENLPFGTFKLTIFTDSCNIYQNVHVTIGSVSDWVFPATITPVTGDCAVANGKIEFDETIFSSVQSASTYVNLGSSDYDIDFILKNGTCAGTAVLFVPTSVVSVVKKQVIVSPMCHRTMDGAVKISLFDTHNKEWKPDIIAIQFQNSSAEDPSIFSQMNSGSYKLSVVNGSCQWRETFDLQDQDLQFTAEHVSDMVHNCQQQTIVKYYSKNENTKINNIVSNDYQFTQLNQQYYSYYLNAEFKSKRNIWVVYAESQCIKTYQVETGDRDMISGLKWPKAIVSSNDCQNPSVQYSTLTLDNPENMIAYSYPFTIQDHFYLSNTRQMFSDFVFVAIDKSTECTKQLTVQFKNALTSSTKTIQKPICPGSTDGNIQLLTDLKKESSQIYDFFGYNKPIVDGNGLNSFPLITNGTYTILRSPKSNPFCRFVDSFDVIVDEPTVSLSSTGVCDASDTPIGDVGVVTNTLSITTTNVTYNLNGHISTNPVFKGLSVGDYSSTVTIYNSVCRRVIQSNPISVSKLPSVSVT